MRDDLLGPGFRRPSEQDLPNGWDSVQLREVCRFVQGGMLGYTKEHDYQSSGFPAFSAAGQDGYVDVAEFDCDGVVLSAIGANCGRCFLARGQWTTLANVQAIIPTPEELSARFLFHRANCDNYWPRTGSAQPFIKPSDVEACWLARPLLPEQERIAEVLDTVDTAIQQTEELNAKLQWIGTGLLNDLLTRGLDEHGQLRDPVAHPEQFKNSPLGGIPKEWDVKTVEECLESGIIEEIQDGNHGELHPKSEDFVPEGVPFLMANDLRGDRINFADCHKITWQQYKSLRVGFAHSGDVLLSHKGTIGLTAIVPDNADYVMLTPQITYYRVKKDGRLLNRFLPWFFRSPRFQQRLEVLAAQTTRSYIGIRLQKTVFVAVPPGNEQSDITSALDAQDARVHAEEAYRDKLKLLKRGLMADLLTGRKRVPQI